MAVPQVLITGLLAVYGRIIKHHAWSVRRGAMIDGLTIFELFGYLKQGVQRKKRLCQRHIFEEGRSLERILAF